MTFPLPSKIFFYFLTRLILGHRRMTFKVGKCVWREVTCQKSKRKRRQNAQKWQGRSISSDTHPLLILSHSCAACVYTLPNLFELQIYRSSEASHFIFLYLSLALSISHRSVNRCLYCWMKEKKTKFPSTYRCEVCVCVCLWRWHWDTETEKNREVANAFTTMTWKSFSMCNSLVASLENCCVVACLHSYAAPHKHMSVSLTFVWIIKWHSNGMNVSGVNICMEISTCFGVFVVVNRYWRFLGVKFRNRISCVSLTAELIFR